MNTAVINIKTQPIVKEKAQLVAKELGFSLSSLVNAYLKQLIQTKTVHFSVLDEEPNAHLQSVMKEAEENLKTGNHSPIFNNIKDELKWLHQQGI